MAKQNSFSVGYLSKIFIYGNRYCTELVVYEVGGDGGTYKYSVNGGTFS